MKNNRVSSSQTGGQISVEGGNIPRNAAELNVPCGNGGNPRVIRLKDNSIPRYHDVKINGKNTWIDTFDATEELLDV